MPYQQSCWICIIFMNNSTKFTFVTAQTQGNTKYICSHTTPTRASHVFLYPLHSTYYTVHKGNDKAVPLYAWTGPEGSRKLRFPDFVTTAQDGGRLSALWTSHLYPPGNTPGTHFCYRLSRTQGHSAIGRFFMSMKNPMTPAGTKPATFRFVAQYLNRCTTAVPTIPSIQLHSIVTGRWSYKYKLNGVY